MQWRILHIVHIRLLGLICVCPLWVEDCHRPLCDSRYGNLHAGKLPFI